MDPIEFGTLVAAVLALGLSIANYRRDRLSIHLDVLEDVPNGRIIIFAVNDGRVPVGLGAFTLHTSDGGFIVLLDSPDDYSDTVIQPGATKNRSMSTAGIVDVLRERRATIRRAEVESASGRRKWRTWSLGNLDAGAKSARPSFWRRWR